MLLLDILVDLDLALQADRVFGDAEDGIRQDVLRRGGASHEDGLAFVLRLDLRRSDIDGDFLQFIECVCVADGVPFIHPKNRKTDDENDEADEDAFDGSADAAEP